MKTMVVSFLSSCAVSYAAMHGGLTGAYSPGVSYMYTARDGAGVGGTSNWLNRQSIKHARREWRWHSAPYSPVKL